MFSSDPVFLSLVSHMFLYPVTSEDVLLFFSFPVGGDVYACVSLLLFIFSLPLSLSRSLMWLCPNWMYSGRTLRWGTGEDRPLKYAVDADVEEMMLLACCIESVLQ